jgi:D-3-phosphoglycerate dehydrogenase / 2-oxoglutarate reductase
VASRPHARSRPITTRRVSRGSPRPRVLVREPIADSGLELLRSRFDVVEDSESDLPSIIGDFDAIVVRSATKLDAALIDRAGRLKVIGRAGVGVDNVDVDAATRRGIVVANAAESTVDSAAEHAIALLLALARNIPQAHAALTGGSWERQRFTGIELAGKTLGVLGLGRIGREVARRALGLGMRVVAYDPFVAPERFRELGVEPAPSLEDVYAEADVVTLHLPLNDETRDVLDAEAFAGMKDGVRIVNAARGELVDEAALADAIRSGKVSGAALDVFQQEPTKDHRLQKLPQVIATPHIAASTREGQELVGVETATALRDYLKSGVIRNAVNFPSMPAEEFERLQPFAETGRRLGCLLGQMGAARIEGLSVRYYGALARDTNPLLVSAVLEGLLRAILSMPVTPVNARAVAAERGIDVNESHSARPRSYTSLLSIKLQTSGGERWVEGTVVQGEPRLVLLNGVQVEAPLDGTMLLLMNNDQPGVIGAIGTILGRHGVNVANFALGRNEHGAVGVVTVDDPEGTALSKNVLDEIRAVAPVKQAWAVRV